MSRDAWLSARRELLAKGKVWDLKQDAPSAERRKLSMVTIEKEYVFGVREVRLPSNNTPGPNKQLALYNLTTMRTWRWMDLDLSRPE